MTLIVPSLLAANFARLGEALREAQAMGASVLHLDVADGHFGPEISVGQPVVTSLRRATELDLDVHLMVERPERYLQDFIRAGADRLIIHLEATRQACQTLRAAKDQGVKAGLALNPETSVHACCELMGELDYLLLVSAANLGGRAGFLQRTLGKVEATAAEREKQGLAFAIEVEGGIGPQEAEDLALAGADVLVVGSAIFESNDPEEAMQEFRRRANTASAGQREATGPNIQ